MINYDNFAETFSNSRKNMKWQEIEYFLEFLKWKENLDILDVWCGNGRLLDILIENDIKFNSYLWVDSSVELINEAKKLHNVDNYKQEICFLEWDMSELNLIIWCKFDAIFFVASFHHLENVDERRLALIFAKGLLKEEWMIFMTNRALESKLNKEKYKTSKIPNSTNEFWSPDFEIKIWEFARFYHSFSLEELEYLAKSVNIELIENREFEGGRNITTIMKEKELKWISAYWENYENLRKEREETLQN
jgi:SAM-dependent methyltransferase